jgi:hypothetical protein
MRCPIESLELRGSEKFVAYRNIATCDPSQDLYDDIADSKDWELLQYADNVSSGIDHNQQKIQRVFQYGNIEDSLLCFDERFWRWGRFGDGSFCVWYGAVEEETSIKETLYHRPEIDKNDLQNAVSAIIQARRLFKADLTPNKFSDLRPYVEPYPLLIHESDYSFCQRLGAYAVHEKLDLFLTQSVRNPKGTCIPVFSAKTIKDKPIRTYFNIFPLDGSLPRIASIETL